MHLRLSIIIPRNIGIAAWLDESLVQTCQLPDSAAGRHPASLIVVCRCAPEIRSRDLLDQFPAAIDVGNQSALQAGEQSREICTEDACIQSSAHNLQAALFFVGLHGERADPVQDKGCPILSHSIRRALKRLFFILRVLQDPLPICHLISGLSPDGVLSETEREGDDRLVFFRKTERQREGFRFTRRDICRDRKPAKYTIPCAELCPAVKDARSQEQIPVCNRRRQPALLILVNLDVQLLVAGSDLLHFTTVRFSCRPQDPISGEFVVGRALMVIPAVAKIFLAIPVPHTDRLVNKVPDKSPLIAGLPFCQIGVLEQSTIRIAHRMRILAQDKRLFRMFLQKGLHLPHRRIHLRFHV